MNDPLGAYLDVVSFNEYAGWYQGTAQEVANIKITSIYQKPLLLSEFGAGAKAGFHADADTRWSEEFQANVYRQQLTDAARRGESARHVSVGPGRFPFAPSRIPGIQDFYNRKGLISDQGQKKQAYYIMQKAYQQRTVGHAQ